MEAQSNNTAKVGLKRKTSEKVKIVPIRLENVKGISLHPSLCKTVVSQIDFLNQFESSKEQVSRFIKEIAQNAHQAEKWYQMRLDSPENLRKRQKLLQVEILSMKTLKELEAV